MLEKMELPKDLAVANSGGANSLLRIYHAGARTDVPDPGLCNHCDTIDFLHQETGCKVICLATEMPETLRLLEAHLALLTEPDGSCRRLADDTIVTSMELACQGRIVIALTQGFRSFVTWAAFERLDDLNLRDILANGSGAAPGFTSRGITGWELESHCIADPYLVNRLFPAPGNNDTNVIALRLQDTFRFHINPALHDPYVFPSELEEPAAIAWTGITEQEVESQLTALATAVTDGTIRGRFEITPATSKAGLPIADIVFVSHEGSESDAARSHAELRFLLECLLSQWEPMGNELGLEDVHAYDQGIRRSQFLDKACYLQIPIREATGHEVIAAAAAAKPILQRIATQKPWLKDAWYGRRTGAALEDAESLLLCLMRRLS